MSTAIVEYVPSVPPKFGEYSDKEMRDLLSWLDAEHRKISTAISGLGYQYQPLNTPPERYGIGYIAYADGVGWDPHSGEGLYVYKSTGWTLIA